MEDLEVVHARVYAGRTSRQGRPGAGDSRLILGTTFLNILAYSFVSFASPKLINLLVSGGQGVTSRSSTVYGDLLALNFTCQLCTMRLWGCISDWCGRKPPILTACAGGAVNFIIQYTATEAYPALYIGYAITGLTGVTIMVSYAYIADTAYDEQQQQEQGRERLQQVRGGPGGDDAELELGSRFAFLVGFSVSFGFLLGIPLSMIIIEHSGIRAAFLSAAIILLLNLAYSACVVPESLPLDRRKPVSLVEANPVGAVECLLSHKGPDRTAVALVTAAFYCVHCADSMLRATWVNFTQVMFDWPMARSAAVFMVLGLSMGCIPRPLISAFGEEGAMQLAAGSFAVAFAFLALVPDERAVIAVVPLMCVGFAAPPTMLGWLAVHFDAKSQGSVMGACETVKTAAYVVGSWVGSTVFAKLISADRTSPDFQPQSVYLISCGLDIIALVLLRCAFSRADTEQSLTTRQ